MLMNDVAALIITYNPEIDRLKDNVEAVKKQVSKVLIVDNASNNADKIKELSISMKAEVLFQKENVGIAKALNTGMRLLRDEKYNWVLTLDQDSVIGDSLVVELVKCALSSPKCAIACPEIKYEGWSKKDKATSTKYQEVKACMTSASLTSTVSWKTVGGYNESYFIDFVDNEFCKKLTMAGYKVIRNHDVVLSHMLGNSGEVSLGAFKIRYSHHSPIRYYYMTRNNIVFVSQYKHNLNYGKELLKVVYNIVVGVITEHNIETIRYILLGIKDANIHRLGRYEGRK